MSTPAAQVLEGANTPPTGVQPQAGAAPQAPPVAGQGPAANQPFWNDWSAPEDKDLRDFAANKNYPDVKTVIKSQRELEGQLSTLRTAASLKGYPADKVNPDGTVTKADDNARKAWNTTMGVPETADKYDIPLPANNPYPQFKTYMSEEFHKAGVPAAMATQLAKGYEAATTKMLAEIKAQEDAQSQAGLLQLQTEWGPKYQENLALANRARAYFTSQVGGMTADKERAMESILGTPTWLNFLAKIGAGNKEPGFAGADGSSPFGAGSAAAAQAELDSIQAQRTAGTIPDYQWREMSKAGGKLDQLRDRIVSGFAPTQQ